MLNQNLLLESSSSLSQIQRLMTHPNMQQALQILQMPALELDHLLKTHLEENIMAVVEEKKGDFEVEYTEPVEEELNFDHPDFRILKNLAEDQIYEETAEEKIEKPIDVENYSDDFISLNEFLLKQAQERFNGERFKIAEVLIGFLDNQGFLKNSLEEISHLSSYAEKDLAEVLQGIQTFDPPGIAVFNLRESLLNQLQRKKKTNSLAFKILEKHYEDLLHGRFSFIKRKLNTTPLKFNQAIFDISHLNLHPGSAYIRHIVQPIIPDVSLNEVEDQLEVKVNDDFIPTVSLNPYYLYLLKSDTQSNEVKSFIYQKIKALKWLFKNIDQRNNTLSLITKELAKKQKEFFLRPSGNLKALTLNKMAADLGIHETTVARAISNKYLCCSKGIYSLRSFFSQSAVHGTLTLLKNIIDKEDKQNPYTDLELSQQLKNQGIHCQRRTISKYRQSLKIGNCHQRKR